MTDPVIRDAIKVRDRLHEVAKELRIVRDLRRNESGRVMAEYDARTCQTAALMLEKLGIEVDRLRQTIGCYRYGRASHAELIHAAETWNDGYPYEMPDVRKIDGSAR